jgi:serine/threonine protein kinase
LYLRVFAATPVTPSAKRIAPESIVLLKFSVASDVYAFGVLAFEVFSFGAFPFESIVDDNAFIQFLAGTAAQQNGSGRMMAVSAAASQSASRKAWQGSVCQPLLEQLASILRQHNVPSVPRLVAALVEACVERDPLARPTFRLLAVQTNRVAAAELYTGQTVA